MKLFTTAKIGMHCDGIGHKLETRKDHEVKIVTLTLRVQPFTAQLAAALDPDWYGFAKRVLFKQANGEPFEDLKAIEFKAPPDRQQLIVFASVDTVRASIAFDQAKVTKVRARTEKGVDGFALVIGVSFGPVGKRELEYVNHWYTEQRFVTFEAAEPSLEFQGEQDDDEDDDDETEDAQPTAPLDVPKAPPDPMFETDAAGRVLDAQADPSTTGPARKRTH
jgi:hypothetical protein